MFKKKVRRFVELSEVRLTLNVVTGFEALCMLRNTLSSAASCSFLITGRNLT